MSESVPKVALCFLIDYQHCVTHEELWKEWIKPNLDIIHVYFHYKNLEAIQSTWIRKHVLPKEAISQTSYMNIVPALMTMLGYAYYHDKQTRWFVLLTETCVPIISPKKFRELFMNHRMENIMKWGPAYWSVTFHKRANLNLLPADLHLSNDPWFVLTRTGVEASLSFLSNKPKLYRTVCEGGLANESLFAIIFQMFGLLTSIHVRDEVTTLCDWTRKSSPTSPFVFESATPENKAWIHQAKAQHPFAMFLRKVSREFPDADLREYWT